MIQKKIGLIGAPAVGKTSLVRRYVEGQFSDEYLTTIGVAISRKVVATDAGEVSLVVWDVNGDDDFAPIRTSYLLGASAVLLVADGTRPATLDHALTLHTDLADALGTIPAVVAVNKRDLEGAWAVDDARLAALRAEGRPVFETSAKSGDAVEAAFAELAARAVGAA